MTRRLGDFFKIKHGYAFKGESFSNQGEFVLLTPGNFQPEGGIKLKGEKEKYYIGTFPEEFILRKGDLLIAMTDLTQNAPILGASAIIPESGKFLHNQRLGKIVELNEHEIDSHFLFYLFNAPVVRAQVKASATGATVRHTAPDRIYSIKSEIPPIETQNKIASILSTYDNLIANNTRRIAILEEMAQRIYEEWFVRFRFPGHEKVSTIESELGPIPKNWEITDIRQVSAYINRGISPKYDDTSEALVINQKCIRDGKLTVKLSRQHSSAVPTDKYVQFGDVLINSTGVGTLGRVAQAYRPFKNYTVDSHVTIVRPSNIVNIDFFGLSLLMKQDEFARLGFGATNQTELNRSSVANVKFLLPPVKLQERFSEIVAPCRKAAIALDLKNDNLRATRDLLLPKLISGEIDVSHFSVSEPASV